MSKEEEKKNETKINNTIQKLVDVFNSSDIKESEVIDIVANFLYSIGASLNKEKIENPEEIIIKYAESPTLANALMAQATHMKETWKG